MTKEIESEKIVAGKDAGGKQELSKCVSHKEMQDYFNNEKEKFAAQDDPSIPKVELFDSEEEGHSVKGKDLGAYQDKPGMDDDSAYQKPKVSEESQLDEDAIIKEKLAAVKDENAGGKPGKEDWRALIKDGGSSKSDDFAIDYDADSNLKAGVN